MTLREGAKYLRRLTKRIPEELARALNETSKEAFKLAKRYSSGSFVAHGEYAWTAKSPHPQPEIINVQTGELLASWARQGPTQTDVWAVKTQGAGGLWAKVYNTAPHAVFMAGTTLMVPRPIMARVKTEIAPVFARNCELALRRAIQVK